MRASTRVKARQASNLAADLFKLLEELENELSTREDFTGYLLIREARESISSSDLLTKLLSIARMGETQEQYDKEVKAKK